MGSAWCASVRNQTVMSEVMQALTEHLVAEAGDQSPQFGVPARSLGEMLKDIGLPLATEQGKREIGCTVEGLRELPAHEANSNTP